MTFRRVSIIGAGSWGTALAGLLAPRAQEVTLWGHDAAQIEKMRESRVNAAQGRYGHIRLAARFKAKALPEIAAIDLRTEFGPDPDVNEIYDHLMRLMQDTLDALAAERRMPILG